MTPSDISIPENVKKVIISISGGLDSTTALYLLVDKLGPENVIAVSFYYGQKQSLELEKAKATCKKLNVEHKLVDISFLGDIVKPVCSNIAGSDLHTPTIKEVLGDPQPTTTVPYRNMIFNSICFAIAEVNNADAVVALYQQRDLYGYWDTTIDFANAINNVTKLNRKYNIELITPFVSLSKTDEIKIGQQLGVDYSLTLTCYNPSDDGKSCGVCPTCSERVKAFAECGIPDPIEYQIDIDWEKLISKFK